MSDSSASELNWRDATPAQEGVWVMDRIERLRPTYLIPSVVEFNDPVDHPVLVAATQRAIGRHPSLRARFRLDVKRRRVQYRTDGEAAQVGYLDATEDGWSGTELDRLVEMLCGTPFDLANEPPARAEVIRVDAKTTLLVVSAHHIAFDGWSRTLLMNEIAQIYQAMLSGRQPELSNPPHPADVVSTSSTQELVERSTSAIERLRGAPTGVELPFRRVPDEDSLIGTTVVAQFDAEATDKVMTVAAQEGCTLFMVGVALLAGTLARTGTQRDFLFAFAWPGRDHPDAIDVIGMFMNTAVLRVSLDEATTWREFLRRSRAASMDAYIDGDVPLNAITAALNPEREVVWPPLTPVLLNLDESPRDLELAAGVRGRYRALSPLYVKYDLALFIRLDDHAGPRRLEVSLDYPTDVFDHTDVAEFLTAIRHSVADLAHLSEVPVLEPSAIDNNLDDPAARRELVRNIWAEILSVDEVDDDISFFEAGGDSLLLVVLVERLSQVSGCTLKTVDLFRAGTIRGQADLLVGAASTAAAGTQGSSRDRMLDAARNRGNANQPGRTE